MKAFAHLVLHELRSVVRDRGVLLVLGIAPLLYALVYPLPYKPQLARELPVGIVDLDRSPLSRQLGRMADASEAVRVVLRTQDLHEAERALRNGAVAGLLSIPAHFERDIRLGRSVQVGLVADGTRFLVYSQAATGLSQAALTLGAGTEIRRLQSRGFGEREARALRDPLPLQSQSLWNPAAGYGDFVVPGVLVLVLQQTLLIALATRGASKRARTRSRIVARATALSLIHALHTMLYLLVIWPLFDFPSRGRFLPLTVVTLLFLASSAGLGSLLGRAFSRPETPMQVLLPTSLPILFLSGLSWPASQMPTWIRVLAWPLPSTHAIPAFVRVQQVGASLPEVGGHLAALAATAALWWGLALLRVGRRAGGRGQRAYIAHRSVG